MHRRNGGLTGNTRTLSQRLTRASLRDPARRKSPGERETGSGAGPSLQRGTRSLPRELEVRESGRRPSTLRYTWRLIPGKEVPLLGAPWLESWWGKPVRVRVSRAAHGRDPSNN